MYGRWGKPRFDGYFLTPERLIEELDHIGIDRALTYHATARQYQTRLGNQYLMNEIAPHPRLVPCWVVQPHHTGEFDAPDELVRRMAAAQVRAVRFFPGIADQRVFMSPWTTGPLFEALAAVRVPLLLDFNFFRRDEPDWRTITEILATYPDLPVILVRIGSRSDRTLYPLLERFTNVYLETSGYNPFRGIEAICQRFGAERLIFGTGMPFNAGGGAVASLTYAQIADHEKHGIASGNLLRLLEDSRHIATEVV
jgi:predicted TIM-barrel fold metal-dependent hydrolase